MVDACGLYRDDGLCYYENLNQKDEKVKLFEDEINVIKSYHPPKPQACGFFERHLESPL